MSRRPPAPPPALPGFRPLQHLGSGGFADVYLYEQDLPRRRVAVKVLVETVVDDDLRRRFVSEANAMAQLSAHPSIVTIYQAGVAPDGRLYLVMEYCARPNLAVRLRREPIPVSEALQIGVRLASAVETAHQAGILHRDIKPANVLVTDYGWPALTDFGIAAQVDTGDQAAGLSVLWAAPELFDAEPRSDRRTDVYALAASVYALLAGRSPFEVPGDNSAAAVVSRIERAPVPSTGRMDSSPQLEQLLARAMHKRSEARPRSALELAQGLQGIERQLGFAPTSIDVRDSLVAEASGTEAEETRVRGVVTIDEDPSSSRPVVPGTTGWSGGSAPVAPVAPAPPRSPLGLVLGLVAAVAVIGVVVGVMVFGPERVPEVGPSASGAAPTDVLPPAGAPTPPEDVECRLDGEELVCDWTPVEDEGARYRWGFQERPAETTTVEEPEFTAVVPEGVSPCVSVETLLSGRTSAPVVRCAS